MPVPAVLAYKKLTYGESPGRQLLAAASAEHCRQSGLLRQASADRHNHVCLYSSSRSSPVDTDAIIWIATRGSSAGGSPVRLLILR